MQDFGRNVDNGGTGSFVYGLICGAALGAAVGLLLAPKTGAEMRQQVADSTNRLRQKASEAYDSASSAVNEVVNRGRRAVDVGREAFERSRPGNTAGESASGMS